MSLRIKIDKVKVNPIQQSNVDGVQMSSYLAPQHVPSSMEVVSTDQFMLIKIFYEVSTPEDTEELDLTDFLEDKESIEGLVINVGKQSKRLVSIKIPQSTLNSIKETRYSSVQHTLNEVREKHPRWGSFTAGANIFQEYGKSINRQPMEYVQ